MTCVMLPYIQEADMAFGKKKEKEQTEKKVKVQTIAMSQNPLYQQQESAAKEILTALGIAFVAVVLFCLIVANFSYYSTGYPSGGSGYGGSSDPGNIPQTAVMDDGGEDTSSEEEIDMSVVDIDGVSDGYVELTGRVVSDGYNLFLQMDEALNFYVFDSAQSKESLVQGVYELNLDEDSALSVAGYEGRVVTAGGSVGGDNGNVVFEVNTIISAEPEQDDTAIHQYQVIVEDCTWAEALTRSSEQGGYLARISSVEEYQYIADMLNSGGYTRIHFYLGGRREDTGTEYYWVNSQNQFMGNCLNSADSWSSSYWYQNEPSYRDTGSGASGEITENVMNLFCVSGTWYLNDSSDNLAGLYPELLSGKVGYIIEYE